jgi:hypothetical protein
MSTGCSNILVNFVFVFPPLCYSNNNNFGGRRAAKTLSSQDRAQAGLVHLAEKLCSFFLLDIHKNPSEHARRDRGE